MTREITDRSIQNTVSSFFSGSFAADSPDLSESIQIIAGGIDIIILAALKYHRFVRYEWDYAPDLSRSSTPPDPWYLPHRNTKVVNHSSKPA